MWISIDLSSNVRVLWDMIHIKDGVKECDRFSMDDVFSLLMISVSTHAYLESAIQFDVVLILCLFYICIDIL